MVLGSIAWRIGAKYLLVMALVLLLAFFAYLAAMLWFAHQYPEQALLEGAEIIQYREQEMAAKGTPSLPSSRLTTPEPSPTARLEE